MSLEIDLIRHAESEMNCNNQHLIGGRSITTPLSTRGIEQAKLLGKRLQEERRNYDLFESSPTIRTLQTTKYAIIETLGYQKPLDTDKRLIELSQGDWEGKIREEIYNRTEIRRALEQYNWTLIPGDTIKGESQKQTAKRMISWIEEKEKETPEGRIGALTHGLAIKFALAELFGYKKQTAWKMPINNTSITTIKKEKGKWSLIRQNDHQHLKGTGKVL